MRWDGKALFIAAGALALSCSQGYAMEALVSPQSKAGVLIGSSAGVPPPGI
jgi:hypothetical protein